jgi:hypothetical protein
MPGFFIYAYNYLTFSNEGFSHTGKVPYVK